MELGPWYNIGLWPLIELAPARPLSPISSNPYSLCACSEQKHFYRHKNEGFFFNLTSFVHPPPPTSLRNICETSYMPNHRHSTLIIEGELQRIFRFCRVTGSVYLKIVNNFFQEYLDHFARGSPVLTIAKARSCCSRLFHSCGSWILLSRQRSATNRTACKMPNVRSLEFHFGHDIWFWKFTPILDKYRTI